MFNRRILSKTTFDVAFEGLLLEGVAELPEGCKATPSSLFITVLIAVSVAQHTAVLLELEAGQGRVRLHIRCCRWSRTNTT